MKKEKHKGKSFLKGAVILSSAGLIAKVMGFIYRIILTRIIGAEGMGLYQLAYPIYTTLLVVSRSGIPVALAKLIAERIAKDERKAAFKIFTVGRYLSVVIGIFFSVLMILLIRPLINILNWDPRAYYPILAISPAVFFVSLMATYRGFFQGLQIMTPTAYSQVFEQWVRMVTMIVLVYYLAPYGMGIAAAGATFGAVTGAIAGLLTLLYIYYKKRKSIWEYVKIGSFTDIKVVETIKEIAALAIPITLGALVYPLMNLVDTVIVPNRLQVAGFAVERSTELFGQLAGVAMVLVNFPTIITISLAVSLVPAISEAFALNKHSLIKERTKTGLRLTILLGLPASVGLYALAQPLVTVVFAVPEAVIPLRIVAWGVIFITLQQTSSAILQGVGQTVIPARNLLIGALTNGIINYSLTAIPELNIRGAALGTTIGFFVAASLNLLALKKHLNYKYNFKKLLFKPLIAVIVMWIIINQGFKLFFNLFNYVFPQFSYTLATFAVFFLAVFVYLFLLLLLQEIKYNDIIMIPKGKKVADKLKKIGLLGD